MTPRDPPDPRSSAPGAGSEPRRGRQEGAAGVGSGPPPITRIGPGPLTVLAVVAVVVTAVAARVSVSVPLSPVPQTLQTLAVVLVGVFFGARGGVAIVLAYLGAGALGLPVFADGAGGAGRLVGPTAGYLLGFVVAAWVVGLSVERGWHRTVVGAVAWMLGAHVVILVLGAAWLLRFMPPGEALEAGVTPFLWGSLLKSAAGAGVSTVWTRLRAPDAEGAGSFPTE